MAERFGSYIHAHFVNLTKTVSDYLIYFFTLSHWRSTSPGETKLLSSEIYEILQSAGQDEAEQAEAAAASCRRKAHFFLGSNNKRAKTVVLHIDGLDDSVSAHHRITQGICFWGMVFAAVMITALLGCVCLAQDRRVEGSGCKCQALNSGTLRLNLNAALQEACT